MMDEPPEQPTYTVYAYAIVRTKHEQVAAATARDAARAVNERYNWEQLQSQAEFANEFDRFVVETDGDEMKPEEFDGFIKVVPQ